jgi:hypothetical protein
MSAFKKMFHTPRHKAVIVDAIIFYRIKKATSSFLMKINIEYVEERE